MGQGWKGTELAELRDSHRALLTLAQVSRAFAESPHDLPRILGALVRGVGETLGDACTVLLLEADGRTLWNGAGFAMDPAEHAELQASVGHTRQLSDDGLSGRVLAAGAPILIADLAADDEPSPYHESTRAYVTRFPVYSTVGAPIIAGGRALGTLIAARHSPGRPYTKSDLQLIAELADRSAIAIVAARQHAELVNERRRTVAMLEQMPSGVALVDAQSGEPLLINDGARAMFRGRPLPTQTEWQDAARRGYTGLRDGRPLAHGEFPLVRSIAHGEVVRNEELEFRFDDGDVRTLRVNSGPVRDESGGIVAGVAVFADITEERRAQQRASTVEHQLASEISDRQRAEQSALRDEQRLRAITDALPVVVAFIDDEERYRFINRTYEAWFGQSREALLGRTVREVIGSVDYDDVALPIARALAGEPASFERKVVGANGVPRHLHLSYVPVRDGSGAIEGYVSLVADVTEARRAEDRLHFLAEASTLLASSLDYETTLKAVCRLAVPRLGDWAAVEIKTGEDSSEQLAVAHVDPAKVEYAWELRERYPPDPHQRSGVPEVMRTGVAQLYEEIPDELLVAALPDPERLRITRELGMRSVIMVAIKGPRGPMGAITLVTAESERRYTRADLALAEELASRAALAIESARLYTEAQQAVQKRDDFLSVASHELKTPLTSLELQLSGLVRAAQTGRLATLGPEKIIERLTRADLQVQRLTTLINELLSLSRISAGKLVLERVQMDLVQLAAEVIARLDMQAMRSGSTVTLDAPRPVIGRWDRPRLDQVVTNLVSNAIKYGSGQPVRVAVRTVEGGARITVSDGGIGIPEADRERVFERFERTSEARSYGGMGLGLWIVRQIVTAHGGHVHVAAGEARGSVFIVDLPEAHSEAP